jgi:translation initiation factor 2B subunit (eIF-2B alpha/beta/delta family)
LIGAALPRRGDLEVLVVDVHQEGGGLVMQLVDADVNALDVPLAGLGAAVADADLVLLEASVVAPTEWLGVAGSLAAASVAKAHEVPVWAVAGVGRFLPQKMWEPVRERIIPEEPWDADDEVVPLSMLDRIVGPTGPLSVADALRRTDCPIATELFKGDVI